MFISFFILGWGNTSPTKYSNRFGSNWNTNEDNEDDDGVEMYDTAMEDYSSPPRKQQSERAMAHNDFTPEMPQRLVQQHQQLQQRQQQRDSPIDYDQTHARLSNYANDGLLQRIPVN